MSYIENFKGRNKMRIIEIKYRERNCELNCEGILSEIMKY